MNFYTTMEYTWKGILSAGISCTVDGSSSVGAERTFFDTYPGVYAGWNLKNQSFLQGAVCVDRLALKAGYSMTANSRLFR